MNLNTKSVVSLLDNKNIMLLFLSDVKSFNGVVSSTYYKNISDIEEERKTETTNESAVRYLAKKKNAPPDKIFYFASQKVQGNIENYNGGKISHVDYFKNRITKDVVGNVEEVMEPCEFNENADIQQTMDTVIEMASKIQKYIGTLSNSTEVTLHVDMTGGMRHASLMMLVITRLIQYSGVKIGNILYSNYDRDRRPERGEFQFVEESNEIYNLFDVISGAYEFVSFGSVEAIQNYFKEKNPQGELKNLLDAMERFSNAIKICQTSIIEGELKNLNVHIENFKNVGNKNLHEKLFANLIDTIQKEYGILLSNDVNRIDIIRWCMDKGFWQQVLTLCTEWLPEIIVDYGIFYTRYDKIQADSKVRGANTLRNWKQNFVISYQNSKPETIDASIIKGFFELVESLNNQLMDEEKPEINFDYVINDLEKFDKLSKFFKEYEDFLVTYNQCATMSKLTRHYGMSLQKLREKYPVLGEIVQNINDIKKNNPNIKDCSMPLNNLPFFMFKYLTAKQLSIMFDLELNEDVIEYVNDYNFTETKDWLVRKDQYSTLLQEQKAASDFKESEMFEMLKGYYDIRSKRNLINHANGNAANEILNLKNMVSNYLNKLEIYKK